MVVELVPWLAQPGPAGQRLGQAIICNWRWNVMSVKPVIRCNCGQRIVAKDVMQTGYYLRLFGPSFVYVKYRCSRCKKLGEQFVKQEDWEDSILYDIPSEVSRADKKNFEALGPITLDEQIEMHFELEKPEALKKLTEEISKELFMEETNAEDSEPNPSVE
jgi:DNA-directed RNA polymerase subunit RPC12/RpoP